jgi:hypothetical protein
VSYAQFLQELHRDQHFPKGRCVQAFVSMHNTACRQNREWDEVIPNEVPMPEHREDEERAHDPIFDNPPDNFEPMPADLTGREVIDFEDLKKLGGRVIGRHEATVDLPQYLTAQHLSRRLRCTAAEAKQLSDCWQALDFTEAMVHDALAEIEDVQAAITRYQSLADGVKALAVDPEDALEHRNTNGFAHNPVDLGSNDDNPEWLLLLNEGVPSAAMIAHRIGVALVSAGDIREALILQHFDEAKAILEQASAEVDDDEDELDVEPTDDQDEDVHGFVSEGWHIMDDKDFTPDWLAQQPAQVQVLFRRVERAQSLADLKALGQKVYELEWTSPQRAAFWAFWRVRKAAVLAQVVARQAKVRKAVEKLRSLQGPALAKAGQKLFALSKSAPSFYNDEAWTAIWAAHKEAKAQPKPKPTFDRKAAVSAWLARHQAQRPAYAMDLDARGDMGVEF